MVRIGVQAVPTDGDGWRRLACEVESLGFDRLLVPDHPGTAPAPFVALAAASAVTGRVRLGTYVANAGAWEPLALASAVATLDLMSDGRAILGIGAGHTPAEWAMRGLRHPSPADRVERLMEVTDVTARLLVGETVSFSGRHVTVDAASLGDLAPVAGVPLLIGGNGRRVLRHAAHRGDIVGMSGLGRTLEDGHQHEVLWTADDIDERMQLVRDAAAAAGRTADIDVLVQQVIVTDDAEAAATEIADSIPGLSAQDALAAPFLWLGTVDEIAAQITQHRNRWDIDSYVVRQDAIDAAGRILHAL